MLLRRLLVVLVVEVHLNKLLQTELPVKEIMVVAVTGLLEQVLEAVGEPVLLAGMDHLRAEMAAMVEMVLLLLFLALLQIILVVEVVAVTLVLEAQ